VVEKWLVLKFGGTSVAGRPQWETIASIVESRRSLGYRVLLVCSALSGVTNLLSDLAGRPDSESSLAEILDIHLLLAEQLEINIDRWLSEAEQHMRQCLKNIVRSSGPEWVAALLSTGEWLSTHIGTQFLQRGMDVDWVDARDALEVVHEPDLSPARRWLSATCEPGRDNSLAERWIKLSPVLVTQGYVGRTRRGKTILLGRGGSDTSAALLAGRLGAEKLEIWTDVPGLFSADPRLIPQARLIREVDYAEALEMAASGARVVQSRCIRAASATDTVVEIRDLNRRQVEGTRISSKESAIKGVKAISCQHNMAVILLQNLDVRHEVGFLAQVFEIFRQRGISVDLVATSETTTTVAVNREANHLGQDELNGLVDDLKERCAVRLYDDCVCVNLVGHGARTSLSRMHSTLAHFEQIPMLMLSQSANDLCLSILVNAGDQNPLLRSAHDALIPVGNTGAGNLFGDSWQQIGTIHE
jgi:diaminopimelate decarboxylase/aspartate kinase